jgi:hypothetical protein
MTTLALLNNSKGVQVLLLGLAYCGFGGRQLGLQLTAIQSRQGLSLFDQVPFMHHNFNDPAGYLGCNIDLRCFDTTVGGG